MLLFSCDLQYVDNSFSRRIDKAKIVREINKMREKGCICGGEKKPAIGKIKWNDDLEMAALTSAVSRKGTYTENGENIQEMLDSLDTGLYLLGSWGVGGEGSSSRAFNEDEFLELAKNWSCLCSMLMKEYTTDFAVIWYDPENGETNHFKGWWKVYLAHKY